MKIRMQCPLCYGYGTPSCDCGLSHLGGHDAACSSWLDCQLCHGIGERQVSVLELAHYRRKREVTR